jgi:hypothetical protein
MEPKVRKKVDTTLKPGASGNETLPDQGTMEPKVRKKVDTPDGHHPRQEIVAGIIEGLKL